VKKFNLYLLMAICLLLSGCAREVMNMEQDIKSVKVENIQKLNYTNTLKYSGYVSAEEVKRYSFELGGKILEIPVKEGEVVKEGDVLAKLDTTTVQMAIDNANENIELAANTIKQIDNVIEQLKIKLESEKINLSKIENTYDSNINKLELKYKNVKDTYERVKTLYGQQAVSKSDFEDAEYAFNTIKEELENTKANKIKDLELQNKSINNVEKELEAAYLKREAANITLNQAQISLEQNTKLLNDSTLTSSVEGYVLQTTVEAGEVVGAGTPVVIVKTGKQVINIGVPVEDMEHLEEGKEVTVIFNEEMCKGTISTVSLYPDEKTRTYNIEIIPQNQNLVLGSLVTVEIPTENQEGYYIPIDAVTNIGGVDYIYIVEKQDNNEEYYIVKRKEVVLGKVYDERVAVNNLDGVSYIIKEGIKDIKENDKVLIVE
jgi:multidrug efflux pump subunit AcrA (membrane-fusion protein)